MTFNTIGRRRPEVVHTAARKFSSVEPYTMVGDYAHYRYLHGEGKPLCRLMRRSARLPRLYLRACDRGWCRRRIWMNPNSLPVGHRRQYQSGRPRGSAQEGHREQQQRQYLAERARRVERTKSLFASAARPSPRAFPRSRQENRYVRVLSTKIPNPPFR